MKYGVTIVNYIHYRAEKILPILFDIKKDAYDYCDRKNKETSGNAEKVYSLFPIIEGDELCYEKN